MTIRQFCETAYARGSEPSRETIRLALVSNELPGTKQHGRWYVDWEAWCAQRSVQREAANDASNASVAARKVEQLQDQVRRSLSKQELREFGL